MFYKGLNIYYPSESGGCQAGEIQDICTACGECRKSIHFPSFYACKVTK